MKNSPSCANVLHKTLNLVISRCCFAEHAKKCTKTYNAPLFLLTYCFVVLSPPKYIGAGTAIAGFHCHAIKIKKHLMNEVKKFTRYRRQINKYSVQASGLCGIPYSSYLT